MISSLRNLSHGERLKRLSMFSLRRRRLRDDMIDMIEVLKVIHGIDKVILGKLFCIDEDERTRKLFLFKNQKACLNSISN